MSSLLAKTNVEQVAKFAVWSDREIIREWPDHPPSLFVESWIGGWWYCGSDVLPYTIDRIEARCLACPVGGRPSLYRWYPYRLSTQIRMAWPSFAAANGQPSESTCTTRTSLWKLSPKQALPALLNQLLLFANDNLLPFSQGEQMWSSTKKKKRKVFFLSYVFYKEIL